MVRIHQDKNDIYIDFTHKKGDQGKFIFVCLKNKIVYLDTSVGKCWVTDYRMASLGKEHRKALKAFKGLK